LAGARDDDRNVVLSRLGDRFLLVGTLDQKSGVENRVDIVCLEDVLRAPDVIALRMCQDQQRDSADAESAELARHVGLGRALVDHDRAFRHLEHDRVSLTDVEHREAQPRRRRWRLSFGPGPPGDEDQHGERGERGQPRAPRWT
jgi:hypothetical protein